jgi:Tfp pilus assembly protein PilF
MTSPGPQPQSHPESCAGYPNANSGRWVARLVLLGVFVVLAFLGGPLLYRYARAEYILRAAETARARREFVEARRLAMRSLETKVFVADGYFLVARIARQEGRYEECERELDNCQRLEGPTERVTLERSLLQAQQGAITERMERQLTRYVDQGDPQSEQILEALARGCMRSFLWGAAENYLNDWIDRDPQVAQAYVWRAMARERGADFAGSKADCRRAAELAPDDPAIQTALAEALLHGGEPEEAAQRLAQLHERQPNNPAIAIALAQSLANLVRDRWAEAVILLDDLVQRYPRDNAVLLERGKLALQMDQPGMAEDWLRRAASLAPLDYQMQYTLFRCLKQLGKHEEARRLEERLRELDKAAARFNQLIEELRQHPYHLTIRCEIAQAFLDQGQDEEGVAWLKSVLKIDPRHRLANQKLYEYYEKTGQPMLALPYREALRSAPALGSAGESPESLPKP